ncbi:MAG: sugar phosphate isomerase/epimerase [Pirellulaceae bacterium]|nr:sugar phosphate isomerase/epimerase [Pirellulaceae bacterium]
MQSAITVSLVPEARQGPFVFHAGLEDACRRASELGFDAIEIFPPSASALKRDEVAALLAKYQLRLAAVGTGAGWVREQLTLVSPDETVRGRAVEFVRAIIDLAGALGAPAIVGSMQGRAASSDERSATLELLGRTLCPLAEHAHEHYGVPLLIEPLNRYETNLLNEVPNTAQWLTTLPSQNLRILADLFHMNIEEADMAASIVEAGALIGHVHFADSNRQAVGLGHAPIADAVAALKQVGYQGYLSAEIFPRPDSDTAARQTIESFRKCVPSS